MNGKTENQGPKATKRSHMWEWRGCANEMEARVHNLGAITQPNGTSLFFTALTP